MKYSIFLSNISTNKTTGPDKISAKLVNISAPFISKHLTIIFNFLDLRKAFDTIDHQIMLKKLRCYGIAGTGHNWFSSYLSNRSQYCQVDGNLSQPLNLLGGIPQG